MDRDGPSWTGKACVQWCMPRVAKMAAAKDYLVPLIPPHNSGVIFNVMQFVNVFIPLVLPFDLIIWLVMVSDQNGVSGMVQNQSSEPFTQPYQFTHFLRCRQCQAPSTGRYWMALAIRRAALRITPTDTVIRWATIMNQPISMHHFLRGPISMHTKLCRIKQVSDLISPTITLWYLW